MNYILQIIWKIEKNNICIPIICICGEYINKAHDAGIRVIHNIPRIEAPYFFNNNVNGKFEEFPSNWSKLYQCFYMFIIMYIHNYIISYTYIFFLSLSHYYCYIVIPCLHFLFKELFLSIFYLFL